MSKLRDIIDGGFYICGDVVVYDCRNGKTWHENDAIDDIPDEVLDMEVVYMFVDVYTLRIEVK